MPGRVLLVDDEPGLLAILKRYLARLGYEVEEFASAAEAWERVESGAVFQLAVIDLTMPGMGGEELARRMLARDERIGVIVYSGYPFDPGVLGKRAAFLHKPFSPDELARVLASFPAAG